MVSPGTAAISRYGAPSSSSVAELAITSGTATPASPATRMSAASPAGPTPVRSTADAR